MKCRHCWGIASFWRGRAGLLLLPAICDHHHHEPAGGPRHQQHQRGNNTFHHLTITCIELFFAINFFFFFLSRRWHFVAWIANLVRKNSVYFNYFNLTTILCFAKKVQTSLNNLKFSFLLVQKSSSVIWFFPFLVVFFHSRSWNFYDLLCT